MASSIAVSCQQTRFDISDSTVFSGLDINGLNITVLPNATSSSPTVSLPVKNAASSGTTTPTGIEASKLKPARTKAADGLEILTNAHLKLNPGVRYALLGKNGSGKSTILRSVAQKLIPGILPSTRISILQQTSIIEDSISGDSSKVHDTDGQVAKIDSAYTPRDRESQSPLQRVLSSDQIRNEIIYEYGILSTAINGATEEDTMAPIRALRLIRLQRQRKQLREAEKNARLRSGARGLQARKDLREWEKRVSEAEEKVAEQVGGGHTGSAPITSSGAEEGPVVTSTEVETREALQLWAELQLQVESYTNSATVAEDEKRALYILKGLGFTAEMMKKGKKFSELSGGWRMRCLLAETLFQPSDILILDEPTNFLDLLGIVWLQRFLLSELDSGAAGPEDEGVTRRGRATVLVSHDRDFVDSICDETIILRDKALSTFRGNPSAHEADLRSRILYMGRMKQANDRQVKAMEKSISENMREGKAKGNDNKIRAAKTRQKRMEERTGLQVSAKGTRFKLNRDKAGYSNTKRDEIEVPTEETGSRILFPEAMGLKFPGSLVSLEKVSFRYKSSLPLVVEDADLVIHMGDRIGLVGLNGCGKTTLIKLITDTTKKPTSGSMTKHAQLKLGYYSQHAVEDLQAVQDLTCTALSLMTKEAGDTLTEGEIRGLLGSLGLPGRVASDVPISKLSGGQLVRLALARIIWNCPNMLVLDEITTHLDHYTVSALIDALRDYEGALLLVSHDRFLIKSVVEGQRSDDDEDEDQEVEEDDARRRIVYALRSGKLKPLEGGVDAFEKSLEKKLMKLAL